MVGILIAFIGVLIMSGINAAASPITRTENPRLYEWAGTHYRTLIKVWWVGAGLLILGVMLL